MIDVHFYEEAEHASKRATYENTGEEETGWYCCTVGDYGHEIPDQEVQQERIVLKYGVLVQQGFDLSAFWVEDEGRERAIVAIRAGVLDDLSFQL